MPKAKAPSAPDPKKRLKKLVSALRADPDADELPKLVADLAALLDEAPAALAEVDKLRALAVAAGRGQLAVVELLLDRGADPRVTTADDWETPALSELVGAWSDDPRHLALIERMIAAGADPNAGGTRGGRPLQRVDPGSLPVVETLLRLGADETSVLAALPDIAARTAESPEQNGPVFARLLAHLADLDRPGDDGLSALHIVALHGAPQQLEQVLARSEDPGRPIASLAAFTCHGCSPPGGGIIPNVVFPPGFTARDAVGEALAVYNAALAWYGADGFDGKRRLAGRDRLVANQALLAARQVAHGAPARGELPGFVVEIDALLERLAAHVGGDVAALRRTAAAVPSDEVGPWNYSSTLLERARPILLRGVVEARVGDSWLAHIVSGDHRRFGVALQARHGYQGVDRTRYPAEARRPLEAGLVVGGRGDELLVVWMHARGVGRVGVASPDAFTALGDDILGFLRGQLAELGVDVADVAGSAAPTGAPGLTRILKADYDHPPGPTRISRVGGLPIGVDADSWPRQDGAPMHHVLTLDLDDHPSFQPRGVRALALFITAPMEHEAYTPRNRHTRILLLSDDDLKKGVPAWPAELADADTLDAGTLTLESAAGLTERELYRHSFAGPAPIWLQGDDTEVEDDEDDDEYDDADGDDERPDPPRRFVLQFDEALIPGINLGDAGIMYVYAETAWFQCH